MRKTLLAIVLCLLLLGCGDMERQKKIAAAREIYDLEIKATQSGFKFEEYVKLRGLNVTKEQVQEARRFLYQVEREENQRQSAAAKKYFGK